MADLVSITGNLLVIAAIMVKPQKFNQAVIVMGVASCGKTTIGQALAERLRVPFTEGDKLHAQASIAKMSAGIPLTDEDRWPWLANVGKALAGDQGHIASCSALKKSYRKSIAAAAGRPVRFIHLHGTRAVLEKRISERKGHFMPATLLDSQLATLEIPGTDEAAITIDIDQSPADIITIAKIYLTH